MIRILKKFYRLLSKQQRTKVVLLFIMMLIGTVFEVCGVSLMLPLVTAIMDKNIIKKNIYAEKICEIFRIENHNGFVIFCVVVLLMLYIVKTIYLIFLNYVQYRFVGNNQFITQEKLIDRYLHRSYDFFLSAESGEIVRIVQSDAEQTFTMLGGILTMGSETVVTFALLITIFVISPVMTGFVATVLLFVMLAITKIVRPVLQKQGLRYQKSYAENNKWLLQAISGIKEIKVTGTERFFLENYQIYGRRRVHAFRLNGTLQSIPRFLIELASVGSMLSVIGIMITGGYSMESLIPTLGAFVMAAVKLLPSTNRIVATINQITFYEPALDNMLANIEETEDDRVQRVVDSRGPMALKQDIRLSNISYSYPGGEKKIFDHADLLIPVGSSVGIVGESGVGKTTAMDILLGLLRPQTGHVRVDSVDISTNMPGWISHIGYIPQMIFMLDGTIEENVVFGREEADCAENDVWVALEDAQLTEFVKSLPKGLNTKIGERGIRLSGGQRQRIGIARALFTNPDVLIFDEATSALDNDTEEAIMHSINALHGKKTMIIIAHRLTMIESCDVVYRVKNGKLVKEEKLRGGSIL